MMKVWMSLPILCFLSCTNGDEVCGGIIQASSGIIQSPNFPKKFKVPIRCRWIINATNHNTDDTSIIVYFTQLFVTRGLKFTEFESFKSSIGKTIHEVTEQNVTFVHWLLTKKSYLVIDFVLDRLEGNHLSVMDNLLDVYGFNLTYETNTKLRPTVCSAVACSFSGHCYASLDFQDFYCSCFPGFSAPDCGHGPLCETKRYSCQNGGVCRHVGDKMALCSCPDGFIGPRCEIPLSECGEEAGCTEECLENNLPEPCSCGGRVSSVPSLEDNARYEVSVQLTDVKAVTRCLNNSLHCQWIPLLELQMTDSLFNDNITMEDLKVTNITLEAKVSFTFIGLKHDRNIIEESLQRIIHKGHLAGLGFNISYFLLAYEPALYLKNVEINQVGYVLDVGAEFILSCIAQGSPQMVFRWFKDGIFVNVSKSQRSMWTSLLPLESGDEYTALLGIDHAESLDQGRYTCQITDHGYQQCRTIVLEVIEPPQLKVYPMSLTVEKDRNITIQCVGPEENAEYSYSWSKNTRQLKYSLKQEYWEKLFPGGSMLSINNIQKSATFTCHLGSLSSSIQIDVMNHSIVPWCFADVHKDVKWDETGPGITAKVECPLHYSGIANRICNLEENKQTKWLTPDYSNCVSDSLSAIMKKFGKVASGYGNTSTSEIMTDLLVSLAYNVTLYPGEWEPYVEFLQSIIFYLEQQKACIEIQEATVLFYRTVNVLLQKENAIINYQKIEELQELVNRWGLMWGNQSGKNSLHLPFDAMVVDLFKYNSSLLQNAIREVVPRPSLSYPSWYSPRLTIHLNTDTTDINNTVSLVVVAYYNLSQFHLRKSAPFVKNQTGECYEMASNIMSIKASKGINVISEIEYEWEKREGKGLRCGVSTDWGALWNLTACRTSQLLVNVTLCTCPMMGSYTVYAVKEIVKPEETSSDSLSGIALIGCVCCLVQSLLTLMFLMFHGLHVPRSYILFIKLLCCSAISVTMVMFLYNVCTSTEQNVSSFISTSLQVFTLIAMSSQLCSLLLVYVEVVYIPKLKHLKQTIIGAVTGTPAVVVLCTSLIKDGGQSGWMASGTLVFYTYVFCVVSLVVVFVFVYLKVYKHLKALLRTKSTESKRAVKERIGLLKRSELVFGGITIMLFSSHLYQNWPNLIFQCIFGTSCALLGCLLILCFIVHSEFPLQINGLHILKMDNTDLGYSSESDNNPENCSDKQESTLCVSRPVDIRLHTLPPRFQKDCNVQSTSTAGKLYKTEVNGLANSGDSNDSGVQLEMTDSRSYVPMSSKPVRSVTFHNDLVTGCDKARTYPRKSPKIKRVDSEVQFFPTNKNLLRYSSQRQPEKRTMCVLLDTPRADILGTHRELKTETRLVR